MERWTIKQLNEINNLQFARAILNERRNKVTYYSPLGRKLKASDCELYELDQAMTVNGIASSYRYAEIACKTIHFASEMLCGKNLYNALSHGLGMTDEEIIGAGFTSLKEYME